ncbi:MAG: amidohydrolase family protein [Clostridia bacterium]|nr:amidohydrolase family protein [Clostridia bacterium]
MKLIDFHAHIYPEKIAEKATNSIEIFYDFEANHIGTKEELKSISREAGIDLTVILPVAVKPSGVEHINDFALKVQNEDKDFLSFGTVHAGMENILEETERIEKTGLHGIKIHPDTQLFSIDDERMFPVYDYIAGKMPLIVHTGDPRYPYSHPEKLKKVMKMFPSLVTVAAHFGGWAMPDTGADVLADMENCYVDLSSTFYLFPIEKGDELISRFGEDRVLFGSDFPLGCPVKEKENLMKLHLSDSGREKIAYKNAENLLKIKL